MSSFSDKDNNSFLNSDDPSAFHQFSADESETEIEEEHYNPANLPPLRSAEWGFWTEDDLTTMVVRGPTFLKDKKKIPCGPPLYKLMHADIFSSPKNERVLHVAERKDSYANIRYEKRMAKRAAQQAAASSASSSSSSSTSSASTASTSTSTQEQMDKLNLGPSADTTSSSSTSTSTNPTTVTITPSSPSPTNDVTTRAASKSTSSCPPSPSLASIPPSLERLGSVINTQPATVALADHPLSPMIIINFIFPGPNSLNMNLVLYFARKVKPAELLRKDKARNDQRAAAAAAAAAHKVHHAASEKGTSSVPGSPRKHHAHHAHHTHNSHTHTHNHKDALHVPEASTTPPPAKLSKTNSSSDLRTNADGSVSADEEGKTAFVPEPIDIERVAAFDRVLQQFLDGSDAFRDGRLKIVPRVAEGGWFVKKSVGRVPAILGKKVTQKYYRDREKNYIEIDADLGTSVMAGKIISLIKGTCKGLVVDMSFILQGEQPNELPESLMGGVRMVHVDIDKVQNVDVNANNNNAEYDC